MSLQSGERLNGFWYEEVVTSDLYLKMELKNIGINGESKYQVPTDGLHADPCTPLIIGI